MHRLDLELHVQQNHYNQLWGMTFRNSYPRSRHMEADAQVTLNTLCLLHNAPAQIQGRERRNGWFLALSLSPSLSCCSSCTPEAVKEKSATRNVSLCELIIWVNLTFYQCSLLDFAVVRYILDFDVHLWCVLSSQAALILLVFVVENHWKCIERVWFTHYRNKWYSTL